MATVFVHPKHHDPTLGQSALTNTTMLAKLSSYLRFYVHTVVCSVTIFSSYEGNGDKYVYFSGCSLLVQQKTQQKAVSFKTEVQARLYISSKTSTHKR